MSTHILQARTLLHPTRQILMCRVEMLKDSPENYPKQCKKKPTNTGAKVTHKKAPSAISLSPGPPPILKYPGMVSRSVLF
jgi:hypothetical protein